MKRSCSLDQTEASFDRQRALSTSAEQGRPTHGLPHLDRDHVLNRIFVLGLESMLLRDPPQNPFSTASVKLGPEAAAG
jgi:hypothetical protein